MKITFLGTGTSTGIPQIGCRCAVCTSEDPRDRRFRTSLLLEECGTRILLDCGPDFREQMMRVDFNRIHAVLLSHEHYDHVGGIDDLRPFCAFGDIPLYMEDYVAERIRTRLPYCFRENKYPGVPDITLNPVILHETFRIGSLEITPFRVMHASLPILGYRINNMAYITDMKTIPEEEIAFLQNLDILVINGLRFEEHISHQTISEACAFAQKINARKTYIIHLSHAAGKHESLKNTMPPHVEIAYDFLIVDTDSLK